MVIYGTGWFASSGSAAGFITGRDLALEAWAASGRPGRPRLVAHCYAGVGEVAYESAKRYLGDYYAHRAAELDSIIGAALLNADGINQRVVELAAAGCDEFILTPVDADPDQVQLLADAAGLS